MTTRLQGLTGATLPSAPTVCHDCVFWQSRPGRTTSKRKWIERAEDDWGAWGTVYADDDGRVLGSMQYGPSELFPRADTLPAGPPDEDAVLITCAYLVEGSAQWVMQSLFLAAIADVRERGGKAHRGVRLPVRRGRVDRAAVPRPPNGLPERLPRRLRLPDACGASAASSWRAWSSAVSSRSRRRRRRSSSGGCARSSSRSRRRFRAVPRRKRARGRGSAPRSASRSVPRPCGGCRSPPRARARSRSSPRRIRPTSTSSRPAAEPGVGKSSSATWGAAPRIEPACSGESGSSVSTQIAWPWPTRTGMRTQVAWIGRSGRPRIFRVSSRSFSSSSNSSPTRSQSIERSACIGSTARRRSTPGVARARHRLVGRKPHLAQACRVVQRLEDTGELDRRAVRVRHDPPAVDRVVVHAGDDERDALGEPERIRLVDAGRAGVGRRRHELRARAGPDREEAEVELVAREPLRRRLFDSQRTAAVLHLRAGRPGRRVRADVGEPALGEQLQRDGPDDAGGADDADPGLIRGHELPPRRPARRRCGARAPRPRPGRGRRSRRS